MKRHRAVRVLVGLSLAGCIAVVGMVGYIGLLILQIPDPATTPISLSRGGKVDVIQIGKREGGRAVWDLEYRTRIAISDRQKLAEEVSALWVEMEAQAERSGSTEALIMPVSFSRRVVFDGWRPVVFSHNSTGFTLEKGADGTWRKTHGWPCCE